MYTGSTVTASVVAGVTNFLYVLVVYSASTDTLSVDAGVTSF